MRQLGPTGWTDIQLPHPGAGREAEGPDHRDAAGPPQEPTPRLPSPCSGWGRRQVDPLGNPLPWRWEDRGWSGCQPPGPRRLPCGVFYWVQCGLVGRLAVLEGTLALLAHRFVLVGFHTQHKPSITGHPVSRGTDRSGQTCALRCTLA